MNTNPTPWSRTIFVVLYGKNVAELLLRPSRDRLDWAPVSFLDAWASLEASTPSRSRADCDDPRVDFFVAD